MLTLAIAPWLLNLMMVGFIALSVLMVLVVLIQRSQGGGLTAAFGGAGAGSGQTAFGTKTGDVLTLITIGLFATWLLFAVGLNFASRPAEAAPQPPEATSAPVDPSGQAPEETGTPEESGTETTPPGEEAGNGGEGSGGDVPSTDGDTPPAGGETPPAGGEAPPAGAGGGR